MYHPALDVGTFTRLAQDPTANTRLSYLYRDADNYKQAMSVVFKGPLSLEQAERLVQALDDEDGFVPSAVGLPDLQEGMSTPWDPEVDHPFHELDGLALTHEPATQEETAAAFLETFIAQDWAAAAAIVEANMVCDD